MKSGIPCGAWACEAGVTLVATTGGGGSVTAGATVAASGTAVTTGPVATRDTLA